MNLEGAIINVPLGGNIQEAIDSAADGDTIQLSAGTYQQPIQIISKNLTLKGAGRDLTIIQAPGASTYLPFQQSFVFGPEYLCVILVDNRHYDHKTVDISDLTVDGNNQQDCISPFKYGLEIRFFAIGYHHTSGTISNVRTTSTRQYSGFDECTGGGIIAASIFVTSSPISFNVTDCLIENYQWVGIDCRGKALTATISNNEVNRGYTLTPGTETATPNGIQFSGSVKGSIVNNTVLGNISTVEGEGGAGILLYDAGDDIVVTQNTLKNNDYSIVSISCAGNVDIHGNTSNSKIWPGSIEADEVKAANDYGYFSKITITYDSTFAESSNPKEKKPIKKTKKRK